MSELSAEFLRKMSRMKHYQDLNAYGLTAAEFFKAQAELVGVGVSCGYHHGAHEWIMQVVGDKNADGSVAIIRKRMGPLALVETLKMPAQAIRDEMLGTYAAAQEVLGGLENHHA